MGVEILGVEDAAVFGAGDIEAMLGAEFGDGGFGDAELAILALYDGVLEAGGLREYEERFFGGSERLMGKREASARGGQRGSSQVAEKLATIGMVNH